MLKKADVPFFQLEEQKAYKYDVNASCHRWDTQGDITLFPGFLEKVFTLVSKAIDVYQPTPALASYKTFLDKAVVDI